MLLPLFRSSALPLFLFLTILLLSATAFGDAPDNIAALLKKNDACILLAPDGTELVSVNGDTRLVPASTLKVLTALVGFYYLGEDYRFPTEIYLNDAGDLTIRGYGDPLLISEVFPQLARDIRDHLPEGQAVIRDILLDDSYFSSPLTIPGVSVSDQPYDAAVGALCSNFNTIAFKRLADGSYASAEDQTPLLPSVLDRIRQTGLKEGRVPLSHSRQEVTGYTGALLAYFLGESGVTVTGTVRLAADSPPRGALLFTHESPYPLSEAASKLLEFSNNFMANQIFIAAGARAYGSPGTLEKGVRAARAYAADQLHLEDFQIVEGSGISRQNQFSARMLLTILEAFTPHHGLLRQDDTSFYKTGTLNGIATRAGYLTDDAGRLYPFVVMLNGSAGKMGRVMRELEQCLKAGMLGG